jgi:hypothetical protein
MTGAFEPSLQERLWVHRTVEWLRSQDCLPDPLDVVGKDADPARTLAQVGIVLPAHPGLAAFLVREVRRVLARCPPPDWHQPAQEDGPVWPEEYRAAPADPTGELEGGRPRVSRMLCRSRRPKKKNRPGCAPVRTDERRGGVPPRQDVRLRRPRTLRAASPPAVGCGGLRAALSGLRPQL